MSQFTNARATPWNSLSRWIMGKNLWGWGLASGEEGLGSEDSRAEAGPATQVGSLGPAVETHQLGHPTSQRVSAHVSLDPGHVTGAPRSLSHPSDVPHLATSHGWLRASTERPAPALDLQRLGEDPVVSRHCNQGVYKKWGSSFLRCL